MSIIKQDYGEISGGTLTYADYSVDYQNVSSVTIPNDYDAVLIVTSFSGGQQDNYKPTYNGITYDWKLGNIGNTTYGTSIIIPNVKANTNITFPSPIWFSVYGYNLT